MAKFFISVLNYLHVCKAALSIFAKRPDIILQLLPLRMANEFSADHYNFYSASLAVTVYIHM